MATTQSVAKKEVSLGEFLKMAALILLVGIFFIGSIMLLWYSQTPAGAPFASSLSSLFAMDSVQAWWYVTRAAGLTSYFLLWLSMVWGMAIPSKFFQKVLEGTFAYDFHEFLSLLGLGFVLLHVVVLMFDRYLQFSLAQVMIPFIDTYRPLWVGFGIIGFYLFLLVTVTFYLRRVIGPQAFRAFHLLSIVGYLGATMHGLFAGTDSALPMTKVLYAFTFLVVFFLTIYWVVMGIMNKREQDAIAARAALAKRQAQRLRASQR